uniref:Uncharacterized protein n=1 Tax=Rhizophora mucronata TaxID=61149 RepID=A0A2P2J3I7_RHIMU
MPLGADINIFSGRRPLKLNSLFLDSIARLHLSSLPH